MKLENFKRAMVLADIPWAEFIREYEKCVEKRNSNPTEFSYYMARMYDNRTVSGVLTGSIVFSETERGLDFWVGITLKFGGITDDNIDEFEKRFKLGEGNV